MDEFDDISEQEALAAAALAEALERGTAPSDAPEEVLDLQEGAALFRAMNHAELSPERSSALRAEVLDLAQAHADKQTRSAPAEKPKWWLLWLPLPALGALFLVFKVGLQSEPEAAAPLELAAAAESELAETLAPPHSSPTASAALLRAQAEILAAQAAGKKAPEAQARLSREMAKYREELLANLGETP